MIRDKQKIFTGFKRPWEASEHFVSNMIELKECFNEITIAKDDTLYFNDKPVDFKIWQIHIRGAVT